MRAKYTDPVPVREDGSATTHRVYRAAVGQHFRLQIPPGTTTACGATLVSSADVLVEGPVTCVKCNAVPVGMWMVEVHANDLPHVLA